MLNILGFLLFKFVPLAPHKSDDRLVVFHGLDHLTKIAEGLSFMISMSLLLAKDTKQRVFLAIWGNTDVNQVLPLSTMDWADQILLAVGCVHLLIYLKSTATLIMYLIEVFSFLKQNYLSMLIYTIFIING